MNAPRSGDVVALGFSIALVGRAVGRKLISARSVSGHAWEHNRRSLSGFTEAAKDIVATLLHDHLNWRRSP
jgi:hypothetical protein